MEYFYIGKASIVNIYVSPKSLSWKGESENQKVKVGGIDDPEPVWKWLRYLKPIYILWEHLAQRKSLSRKPLDWCPQERTFHIHEFTIIWPTTPYLGLFCMKIILYRNISLLLSLGLVSWVERSGSKRVGEIDKESFPGFGCTNARSSLSSGFYKC